MSVQTGSLPPPGPVSMRFVDRARFRVRLWQAEPNPLWIRELRQSVRLARTPVILAVLAVLMTLLVAFIGGVAPAETSPATTGVLLFQVFFSVAYFVVTLIGPAVAANSIASEREGRTWEAVILTGLTPATIARGKLLAALTSIGMYVVMLAPVGAMPFLFGGVTATEVVLAFAGLFLVSLLSVAFGLAISSMMTSLRAAILVTLLLAFPISAAAFTTLGVSMSFVAHRAWPAVVEGPPIWLPAAYERVPFDVNYVVYLVLLPLLAVVLPAWFLYEVTIANLTGATDDRSSGLKRWFLAAAPLLTGVAVVPLVTTSSSSDRLALSILGVAGLAIFLTFCVFLFAGDPVGPSRRVSVHWDRRRAGALRRFLGPGVMRSAFLLLVVGGLAILGLGAVGFYETSAAGGPMSNDADKVILFTGYAFGFYIFVVGMAAFLRARASSPIIARVLLFAVLFGVSVGPWIVAAVAGLLTDHSSDRDAFVVAAPSPFFVFMMLDAIGSTSRSFLVVAGGFAMVGWGVVGAGLLAAASERCRKIIRRHEALLAEGERLLAAEDEAAREAAVEAEEPPADEPADEPEAEPAAG